MVLKKKLYICLIITALTVFNSYAQNAGEVKIKDTITPSSDEFNMLSPAKAAFYSAVLPGLGQAYNKKYWKIPIVYGALGSGIYFYQSNNTNFNRARTAFKLRINEKPDEFDGLNGNIFLSKDALISAQKSYKKDRDLSLLVTIGLYVLQIVEASVNAHLLQHNVDSNLSVSPSIIRNDLNNKAIVGTSVNFNF
ncbi:MAG: hypothetical protein A3F91_15580 [Flavobacteria bacterium RIFCSPLOWO2_12_FULL_35_11]|nr:MAG: hypothetical protein A3F91_15580 [Flavobacteria bacterium RIFCSPLOWO2_12_FULL_35_11]